MNDDPIKSGGPNWGSVFWRMIYLIIGLTMLVVGRFWMSSAEETTMMPLLVMIAGIVVVTIAVRQWPKRRRY